MYVTNAVGCGFGRSKGWEMQVTQMVVNPGWAATVAKFEICNDAGCFDQAYEAQKLAKALPCSEKSCM